MKQISKILGQVAFASAALCASYAHADAGQYSQVSLYNTSAAGTYIGIMDPTVNPNEIASIFHQPILNGTTFTDYWVVDIIPTGNTNTNLSFLPSINGSISGFGVSLYRDQAPITNLANATFGCASVATTVALGCAFGGGGLGNLSLIATTNTGSPPNFAGLQTAGFLTEGRYVFVVQGSVGASPLGSVGSYNGSITVNQVPEPGTLALAGLALLGSAAAMRKRKSA